MPFSSKKMNFPVISIDEFIEKHITGNKKLLYNVISGEKHIDKPHKHDFFIIVLFEQAKGKHTIDFVEYEIANKQIHVLFPGQVHEWHIKEGSKGFQLMIDMIFFERFSPYLRFSITNYTNNPVISLSDSSFDLLKYEFESIKNEIESANTIQDVIYARTSVIAAIVSKEAESAFNDAKVFQTNPKLAKFHSLIDTYFKEEKLVSFYAEKLHISANYLNILCKKHLQISATQLIQKRVLLEAKRLLQSTELSIKEIAFDLGFVDHAYFSNFFKNQTKITPSQFRQQ